MSRSNAVPPWLACYSELLAVWTKRAGCRVAAEDATHDAVLALLERDQSDVIDARAYLHRSVRNNLTDAYRHRVVLDMVPLSELAEADHPLTNDALSSARATELMGALMVALEDLPAACRQAFLWQRLEGRSQDEIAQDLGVSIRMVQTHMLRAARHLQMCLKKFDLSS